MPHLRLNERTQRPNPYINFTVPLLPQSLPLLQILAAQVKPVMKKHGFHINSFEEYPFNKVFAGRNWNAGEVVELVLRGSSGQYLPKPHLLSVLCHELAHIKHMNHGKEFQKLNIQLRAEVNQLMLKGYSGDGFWSTGQNLNGQTIQPNDESQGGFEYICGGSGTKARRKTTIRRKRKKKFDDAGSGNLIDPTVVKGKGKSTFRKSANSKAAVAARAEAAERRLQKERGLNTDDQDTKSDGARKKAKTNQSDLSSWLVKADEKPPNAQDILVISDSDDDVKLSARDDQEDFEDDDFLNDLIKVKNEESDESRRSFFDNMDQEEREYLQCGGKMIQ